MIVTSRKFKKNATFLNSYQHYEHQMLLEPRSDVRVHLNTDTVLVKVTGLNQTLGGNEPLQK